MERPLTERRGKQIYRNPRYNYQPVRKSVVFRPRVLVDELETFCDISSIPENVMYAAFFNEKQHLMNLVKLRTDYLMPETVSWDVKGVVVFQRTVTENVEEEAGVYRTHCRLFKAANRNIFWDYVIIKRNRGFSVKRMLDEERKEERF